MADDTDISGMPEPPADLVDISGMPEPPADGYWDKAKGAFKQLNSTLLDPSAHPVISGIVGGAENALSAATAGVGSLADAMTGSDPGAHDFGYQPRTEAGQDIAKLGELGSSAVGNAFDATAGTGPLASTIKERVPEALGAIGTVVAPLEALRAPKAPVARPYEPPPAPAPIEPGALTGADLRAQPDPLALEESPPRAPASDIGQGEVPSATPEPSAAPSASPRTTSQFNPPDAVRFTPPSAEGARAGEVSSEEQASRTKTLQDLSDLAGGALEEHRKSAVSGDTGQTGQDWAHAKIQDLGGERMQGVIAGETNALRSASDNLVQRTGALDDGVDQPALHQRGAIISGAISSIEDWFDTQRQQLYKQVGEQARGLPISTMPDTGAILGDESAFAGTTEGEALYRGARSRATKLGLIGKDGAFKPATVEQVEQFRQFLGKVWTPRTADVINRLKTAMDSDVAQAGGADLYKAARAITARQKKLLEEPKGISRLLSPSDKLEINRSVPLEQVPDYITNLPHDQFNHVVNVLKSAAHLGKGELADTAAAALREIKGHMAAKLHEAGSTKIQGGWDAKSFYKQLNQYSTKMPSIFSPEDMRDWKTVNDASNVLRMDRTYKGAKVEEFNTGLTASLRSAAGNIARGAVDVGAHSTLHVAGPLLTEGLGIGKRVGRFIGGDPEKAAAAQRLQNVETRIQKLRPRVAEPPKKRTGGNAITGPFPNAKKGK